MEGLLFVVQVQILEEEAFAEVSGQFVPDRIKPVSVFGRVRAIKFDGQSLGGRLLFRFAQNIKQLGRILLLLIEIL